MGIKAGYLARKEVLQEAGDRQLALGRDLADGLEHLVSSPEAQGPDTANPGSAAGTPRSDVAAPLS